MINRQVLTVFVFMILILLVGCAGLHGTRNVGIPRPVGLSQTSMCAIDKSLVDKEIYITRTVVSLGGREFRLECQEMKRHYIWVDTEFGQIPSPKTAGVIVGIYGIVTTSDNSDELRVTARGIEYLGQTQMEESHKSHEGKRGHGGCDM